MKRRVLPLLAGLGLLVGTASAGLVNGEYTASGGPGAWVLNFKFTNNYTTPDMELYFIEIDAPTATFTGFPPNWSYYGPFEGYSGGWLNYGVSVPDMIHPFGGSLSGFQVTLTDATLPTTVPFFGYLYNWVTSGPENPKEYGVANLVPEPASLLVLGGAALLALRRRRSG